MKFREIDHDVPGGCRSCGAGVEVTTHPITSRMIETVIPCRCPAKPELEVDPRFLAQLTAECVDCGKPVFRNAARCPSCGMARQKRVDFGRRRECDLTPEQIARKREANRRYRKRKRDERSAA